MFAQSIDLDQAQRQQQDEAIEAIYLERHRLIPLKPFQVEQELLV